MLNKWLEASVKFRRHNVASKWDDMVNASCGFFTRYPALGSIVCPTGDGSCNTVLRSDPPGHGHQVELVVDGPRPFRIEFNGEAARAQDREMGICLSAVRFKTRVMYMPMN